MMNPMLRNLQSQLAAKGIDNPEKVTVGRTLTEGELELVSGGATRCPNDLPEDDPDFCKLMFDKGFAKGG